MESVGEEKKLQALFSELKVADEQMAPRFAPVWNRAGLLPRRSRAFNPAFVAAALLVCALVSLAVWSRYWRETQPNPVASVKVLVSPKVTTTAPAPVAPTVAATSTPAKENVTVRRNRPPAQRNATQLAANRKLTREAKAMTDWESPTSALLSSSSDELFSSLPELNENASELKSFLPSRPN